MTYIEIELVLEQQTDLAIAKLIREHNQTTNETTTLPKRITGKNE